jgi:hypothetical protein
MKKVYLLFVLVISGLVSFGQPQTNNVDIGLFNPGSHGSNGGLGAYVEVSLRIKPGGVGYASLPVAENYGVYLIAPKTDFTTGDVVQIMEVNSAIYGTTSTSSMIDAGVLDIGPSDPDNLYFPIILNTSGLNLSSLSPATNAWSFTFSFKFNNAKTQSAINKLKIVDQTNNTAFSAWAGGPVFTVVEMSSQNQLTPGAFTTLPVSFINLSGYKNGSKNTLNWKTAGEQNNRGFEVQRSGDGINYSAIGFVNTLANDGNSSTELSYSFDDNSPAAGKKQYYQLKQIDIDGRTKLTNIIVITGEKPTALSISGLFPNPARTNVKLMIEAPQAGKITVLVTDMNGKTVIQKVESVGLGSNTIPVDITTLATGRYLIKLLCQSSDCETAIALFNK